MAEKRVSVRLAAVGGKQVKAEFEGIGNAGQRGIRKVSREAEIANARLARFARRAKSDKLECEVHQLGAGTEGPQPRPWTKLFTALTTARAGLVGPR